MAPAKSLDKVISSSQNGEGAKKVLKKVSEPKSIVSDTSELEYWKNKVLELEGKKDKQIYVNISPNDMIEVISLCNDRLNLNTKQHNLGNRYSFDFFGETKSIMFSELTQIKETQRNFARKGYFLINNPSAVRLLGLEEDYKKVLNVEKINNILSNSVDAEKLFKSANEGQRNIIVDMLINKLVLGEKIDMNLIYKISNASGIDINKKVADQKESIERNKLVD